MKRTEDEKQRHLMLMNRKTRMAEVGTNGIDLRAEEGRQFAQSLAQRCPYADGRPLSQCHW
jgi:hypothetical protein